MASSHAGTGKTRRQRFAGRSHREREAQRRRAREADAAALAAIERHEPEHPTGCVVCLAFRMEARRR